jgi:glycosyltransferase involved in cell wall biosynthesis
VKIAYLINTYPQASQSFIRREIAALEAMGLHIERFTVRRWNTPLVDPGDRAERQRTRCLLEAGALRIALATLGVLCRRPRRWWTTLGMALRLGWRSDRGMAYQLIYFAEACLLLGWLEASGIEHVHAHFGTNAPMLALLCRHLGGPPYSFTVHGPEEFERPRALKLAQKIASAQSVAAVSEFGRSQLYLWCAAEDWDKIHVIHCGVDRSFLDAQSPPCTAARLVCVGRLAKQKGQLLLVRAAGLLAQRHVDFELRLIGDGPLRPEIEALIARLGLQQQVRLCGWLSN